MRMRTAGRCATLALGMRWLRIAALAAAVIEAFAAAAQIPTPPELVAARELLAAKQFVRARRLFKTYAHAHPQDARGPLGLGDSDLAQHRYEAAELEFRHAVNLEPQLWIAHKDLVLVEARLHRWEEFERERALLRAARQRRAPGITPEESDLIDTFTVNGREWLVREYIVPVGRSRARYNFEQFSPAGKVEEYISLEPADAAQSALRSSDSVAIGRDAAAPGTAQLFALSWYTAHGHGVIRSYAHGEPPYETLRTDVLRFLARRH